MLEKTFHTPLPLELEVGIPSGDIEVETTEGEESNITVDGDERLLEEVDVRHDGNRVVVAFRGKGKFGFSLSPLSLVFSNELRVRASVPHGAGVKVKTASADTQLGGHFGLQGTNRSRVLLENDGAELRDGRRIEGRVERMGARRDFHRAERPAVHGDAPNRSSAHGRQPRAEHVRWTAA